MRAQVGKMSLLPAVEDVCFPLDMSARVESVNLFFLPESLSSFLVGLFPLGHLESMSRVLERIRALPLPLRWWLSPRPPPRSLSPDFEYLSGPGWKVLGLSGSIGAWSARSELHRDQTLGGSLAGAPGELPSRGLPPAGTRSPFWAFSNRYPQRLVSHLGFVRKMP